MLLEGEVLVKYVPKAPLLRDLCEFCVLECDINLFISHEETFPASTTMPSLKSVVPEGGNGPGRQASLGGSAPRKAVN